MSSLRYVLSPGRTLGLLTALSVSLWGGRVEARPPRGPPPPGGSRAASRPPPAASPSAASPPAPAPAPAPARVAPSAETPPAPQPAVVARPEQPKTVVEEPLDSGFRPPALPVWGDGPPPTGYVLHEQRNTGLIVGGVVAFSAVYATSLIYGASANFEEGLGGLGVPLLGPWIAIASRDFSCTYDPTQAGAELCQQQTVDEAATLAVLSALGIGQLLGATLTVVGIFDKESLWIRADAVDARFRFDSLSVAGGSGLQIRGEF